MDESRHFILTENEQRELERYRELRRRGTSAEKLQAAFNVLGPNGRRIAKKEDRERDGKNAP